MARGQRSAPPCGTAPDDERFLGGVHVYGFPPALYQAVKYVGRQRQTELQQKTQRSAAAGAARV